VRCFIAVGGQSDLSAAMASWLNRTRDEFPELSVSPAQNLHLTLAFLGELNDARVEAAAAATDATASGGAPWRIGWGEPGAFPNQKRPRVLWLGLGEGEAQLREIHGRLNVELAARDLPVDAKPYRPHLTLARVRRPPMGRERAAAAAAWLDRAPSPPALDVDSLVLYQSRLGKPAAVHEPIRVARF
jgi:RNA 2',3'-cyclic 3'-phosphodiesterase